MDLQKRLEFKASGCSRDSDSVSCSKHITAVIGGIIHDTYDHSRGESRCVYGYFTKGSYAANVE